MSLDVFRREERLVQGGSREQPKGCNKILLSGYKRENKTGVSSGDQRNRKWCEKRSKEKVALGRRATPLLGIGLVASAIRDCRAASQLSVSANISLLVSGNWGSLSLLEVGSEQDNHSVWPRSPLLQGSRWSEMVGLNRMA